jgi:glutamate--cysteine ligase
VSTSPDVQRRCRGDRWEVTCDAALAAEVERQFAPSRRDARLPWVGAELELIAVTDEPRPRAADPRVLSEAFDRPFLAAARPGFGPGGQLRLRPPPQPTAKGAVKSLRRLANRAMRIGAKRDIRVIPSGTNPWLSCTDVPLWTCAPRYVAMQRQFDEIGPDGRRMMRLTAGLKVTVDLLADAAWEQWAVATLAAPLLAASFANSPYLDGQPVHQGARTRIWHGVDLRRTGYDLRHFDQDDPIRAYTAFAAKAPRFDLPEAAAPAYHLTTLFPPVRPRQGRLEVRFIDAQPLDRLSDAVSAMAVLLAEPAVLRTAYDLLVRDAATAADLLALVGFGRGRLPRDYLP